MLPGMFSTMLAAVGASAPATDPNWANVRTLISARNGSIQDLAASPATLTINGDPVASTDQAKFGTHSIRINNAGSNGRANFISAALASAANYQTPLTIEGWLYRRGQPNTYMGWLRLGGSQLGHNATNTTFRHFYFDSATRTRTDDYGPTGQWYHLAHTRDASGLWRTLLNGVLQATTGTNAAAIAATTFWVGLGNTVNDNCSWYGYLDEIRITDGVCRYTASFTPPTERFPVG